MQHSQPIAYFYTITTYGTWLHGDERGSVNRKGETLGTHYLKPYPKLEALRKSQLAQEPLMLDAKMRDAVQRAIEAYCAFKNLNPLEINVRTNHVHAAIAGTEEPTKTLQGIKAYATRALRDEGLIARDRSAWTSGGSKQKCFTPEDVERVREYIRNGQGADLPRI